jgi:hypothetical protein
MTKKIGLTGGVTLAMLWPRGNPERLSWIAALVVVTAKRDVSREA